MLQAAIIKYEFTHLYEETQLQKGTILQLVVLIKFLKFLSSAVIIIALEFIHAIDSFN